MKNEIEILNQKVILNNKEMELENKETNLQNLTYDIQRDYVNRLIKKQLEFPYSLPKKKWEIEVDTEYGFFINDIKIPVDNRGKIIVCPVETLNLDFKYVYCLFNVLSSKLSVKKDETGVATDFDFKCKEYYVVVGGELYEQNLYIIFEDKNEKT